MGAYLSEPLTEKTSEDEESAKLRVGSSSMQGWRVSQEDAHNTLLEYEEDSSYFAVYDGHGGHEVAAYTANKLPDFIKACELYKKGEIEKALEDSFVEFDRTIVNREVVGELKVIAGTAKDEEEEENEAQEVDNLFKEATMPIEEVISNLGQDKEKSSSESDPADESEVAKPVIKQLKLLGEGGSGEKKPISPFLRAKKTGKMDPEDASNKVNTHIHFDEEKPEAGKADKAATVPEKQLNGVKEDKNGVGKMDEKVETKTEKTEEEMMPPQVVNGHANGDKKEDNEVHVKNGDSKMDESEDTKELKGDDASSGEKISTKGKGKGKGKGKSNLIIPKKSSEGADQEEESPATVVPVIKAPKKTAKELYSMLKDDGGEEMTDDDSDDSEEGKEAWGGGGGSDSDDDDEEEEEEEEEDEEDESDTDDDEEELGEDEEYIGGDFNEEPGNDSGCTAVVALLKGQDLYVANAGDSRCVVSRNGKALEMSFDHKPEDDIERNRIQKAGGKVTPDGRVNGGLNLSRAIGDHAYKTNKSLPLTEQMISPVPDIKKTVIDLVTDDFMVLACDGIWNSMSSQEVISFVGDRLKKDSEAKLSTICEELFDHCLSPDTLGDGTGCDNMTAVIVQFRKNFSNLKRTAEPEGGAVKAAEELEPPAKKACISSE